MPAAKSRDAMRAPNTSSTRLEAMPPIITWRTRSTSSPQRPARARASAAPSAFTRSANWWHALVVWPVPDSPTRITFGPSSANSGFARSTASAGPPTIMVSVASRAPCGPPDTGESSMSTPRSPSRPAMVRVAVGSMVLMSMTRLPGRAPWTTPSGPSSTCSTSRVPVTMVKTTSLRPATAAGVGQTAAPAAARGRVDSARRANTAIAWPPFIRWSAIGRPIVPSPMNPSCICRPPARTVTCGGPVARSHLVVGRAAASNADPMPAIVIISHQP